MKKFGHFYICFIIIYSSCASKLKKTSKDLKQLTYDQKQNTFQNLTIDTALYISCGDTDTALALFLYCYSDKFDYDSQKEEYIRWNLENTKIDSLLNILLGTQKDYSKKHNQIVANNRLFIDKARNEINEEYVKYFSIMDTQEFELLLKLKDRFLKSLIEKMLKNPKVKEKQALKKVLITTNW